MRRQLIAIAAGVALGAASLVTPALAAHGGGGGGGGGHGGGGGGHASFGGGGHASFGGGGHASFGGGGRAAFTARSAPSVGMTSNFATARSNLSINHTILPNASPSVRGNFAANGHPGNWNHGHWGRGYGYGGGIYAFGGYGPDYGYDYGPDYYDYSDNGCLQQAYVQTVYGPQLQWVNVCQ